MFGKKCSLCGGDLDGRNICKECGLNNNKSEKNYKVNQSSCDGQPLTHIHEEKYRLKEEERKSDNIDKTEKTQREYARQRNQYTMPDERGTGCAVKIVRVLAVIAVIAIAAAIIINIIDKENSKMAGGNYIEDEESDTGYKYDPYNNLEQELSDSGDSVEYTLTTGDYIVGFHIPEGKYIAETKDKFDVVRVEDFENHFLLYEYEDSDDNKLDDLRLFNGAVVTIICEETVRLTSDNAQTAQMEEGIVNPLIEGVEITGGKMKTAGEDFEAGIYDANLTEGRGNLSVKVFDEKGHNIGGRMVELGGTFSEGTGYMHLVLPEGAAVECEEGMTVELIPSESILSEDYLNLYDGY